MNPIRVGLVGLGRAGTGMHFHELKSRQDKFRFAAVCDLIGERCELFVKEFGSKPYTKYEDMLADPEVELVTIATRSCDHFRHAKMALEAGKDVMVEKPFSMKSAEVRELIRLGSQPAGPHLYVRHNRRFERGFEIAQEIIDSGRLGQVYEIKLTRNGYQRRNDWQTLSEFGGGQLLNWGPHIIDHSLRFCGGDYVKLYSELRHVAAAGDCEDHIKIVFTGVNGRIVDMEISGGAALPTPEYLIYGSKGSLVRIISMRSSVVNMYCLSVFTPTAMTMRSKSASARRTMASWPAVKGSNDPGIKRDRRRESRRNSLKPT